MEYPTNIDVRLSVDQDAVLDQSKTTFASGRVTLDGVISFPVFLKRYTDKNDGQQKMFVAYPQKKTDDGYTSVVYPSDKDVRKEIDNAVIAEFDRQINPDVPDIDTDDVRVTILPPDKSDRKVKTLGIATVKVLGITISGVQIKEGQYGRFIEMPKYKNAKGEYKDIVFGTVSDMNQGIKDAVLYAYDTQMKQFQKAKEAADTLRDEGTNYSVPSDSDEIIRSRQNYQRGPSTLRTPRR